MNIKTRVLVVSFCMLAAVATHAQAIPDAVRQNAIVLRDKAMKDSTAYDIVESLTMEVGPRLAGSAGDAAAVRWAIELLTSLGFENVRGEQVEVPHWDRGALSVNITGPFPQSLVATSLGGSPGTLEEGIEAPVLRVDSLAELREKSRDEVAGHIVYIDQVMERLKTGGGYSPVSRIRSCGHVVAAERGALATVMRSAGTSTHRAPHTGSMIRNSVPADIPGVALSNADADMLTYQVQSGEPVTIRLHSTARNMPTALSANVIGEIPGAGDQADEIVLLGAHLDSWDLGTGAVDDGAGVAIVTAAAKLILDSGQSPRRTVRVVLYANEEFGLSGAKQYAIEHADKIEKHVVAMEADFGAGAVWQFSSRVAEGSLDIVDELHGLLEPMSIERGNNESYGGADLIPLRRAGVPILGMTQDGTDYFDYHHTPDDTLDKIDREDLQQNVAAYVTAAYVAANIERDFGRLAVDAKPWGTCAAEDD